MEEVPPCTGLDIVRRRRERRTRAGAVFAGSSAAGGAVKGIRHVRASSAGGDCDHVEAGRATQPSGASEERNRKARQPALLASIHSFEPARASASLDLDEDDDVAVDRDEIELTEGRSNVPGEDLESFATKKLGRRILAISSEFLSPVAVRAAAGLHCVHGTSVRATVASVNVVDGMIFRAARRRTRPIEGILASPASS
jgi:hypothetical protein